MGAVEITKPVAEGLPRSRTRFVRAYYRLSILTAMIFLFIPGRLAFAADLIAQVFYLAATALFYGFPAGTSSHENNRQLAPRDS